MSDNPQGSISTQITIPLVPNSAEWLEAALTKHFKIPSLRDFQLHHSLQIINGSDLMLMIATGQGKTVVLLAGLVAAHERGENAICIYVAPTKALVEQQAVRAPSALQPLAINEDTLRAAAARERDLLRDLKERKGARLAVMTPQMFTGSRFSALLRSQEFKNQIKYVAIDEAHLVDDLQSGPFFGPYNGIHVMRNVLPSSTTWVVATGSATVAQERLMAARLSLVSGKYIRARHPLDRPNIMYDIRFFRYPTSTDQHLDLSFLVPFGMKSPHEIEKTIVFHGTFVHGYSAMCAVDALLPHDMPDRDQVTRMYGSIFSPEYKAKALRDLQDPSHPLRILFATDAVTFGMDVHGIYRVVIVDPTAGTLNTLKQQVGRIRGSDAARAVILVPIWVKIVPSELVQSKQQQEDQDRRSKLPADLLRFLNAGRTDGYSDAEACCPRALDCMLNKESFTIQAPCCNVHANEASPHPDELTVDRWANFLAPKKGMGKDLRTDKTFRSLSRYPAMQKSLAYVLDSWARRTYAGTIRTEASLHLPSSFIFPPSLLNALPEKAHLCTTLPRLLLVVNSILPNGWVHFDAHGQALLDVILVAMAGYTDIIREASRQASLTLGKMNKDLLEHLCHHYKISFDQFERKPTKGELLDVLVEYLAE
ncbi:P-loop containing nucleoside triphosphate hydrolase protein [Schizophyllum commune Loenen D]|nr:P-loop containing nucleoside triphosphate hydrolase protein [Schizophyllum commune Loenen D]